MSCLAIFQTSQVFGYWGFLKSRVNSGAYLGSCQTSTETTTGSVLWKKVFLKNSQNSRENTCARASFLIKLQARGSFLYERNSCSPIIRSSHQRCSVKKRCSYKFHKIHMKTPVQTWAGADVELIWGRYTDFGHPNSRKVGKEKLFFA